MQRGRQVIERSSALVAQNFDNELAQARPRCWQGCWITRRMTATAPGAICRRVTSSAEFAIDDGDLDEAQNWLDTMKEEPFRILGRRAGSGPRRERPAAAAAGRADAADRHRRRAHRHADRGGFCQQPAVGTCAVPRPDQHTDDYANAQRHADGDADAGAEHHAGF
ncbi:MAG: hypothetical protein U0694_16605 [Anaerolineae bacterium]